MNKSVIARPCAICQRQSSMWCSRCESIWYCSNEHHAYDWARHRNECTPAPAPMANQVIRTPSPAPFEIIKVSALVFFPNQERPQMVTVSCQTCDGPQIKSCPTPLVQEWFTEGRPQAFVLTHGISSEPLRFPLHIFYCPTSLSRGTPPNRAIERITAGAARKPWAGPVLVLKFNGSRRQNYTDVSTNDLPTISAHFLTYK